MSTVFVSSTVAAAVRTDSSDAVTASSGTPAPVKVASVPPGVSTASAKVALDAKTLSNIATLERAFAAPSAGSALRGLGKAVPAALMTLALGGDTARVPLPQSALRAVLHQGGGVGDFYAALLEAHAQDKPLVSLGNHWQRDHDAILSLRDGAMRRLTQGRTDWVTEQIGKLLLRTGAVETPHEGRERAQTLVSASRTGSARHDLAARPPQTSDEPDFGQELEEAGAGELGDDIAREADRNGLSRAERDRVVEDIRTDRLTANEALAAVRDRVYGWQGLPPGNGGTGGRVATGQPDEDPQELLSRYRAQLGQLQEQQPDLAAELASQLERSGLARQGYKAIDVLRNVIESQPSDRQQVTATSISAAVSRMSNPGPFDRIQLPIASIQAQTSSAPATGSASWQQRIQSTAGTNLRRHEVDADPATTHTTIVAGAGSGRIARAYLGSALSTTNMPVVAITSRPGEDQPGSVRYHGISRGLAIGNQSAARGQLRETGLTPAWQQQMRQAQNTTFVFAAAPPMDQSGDSRFYWFARPTLPVWLAHWVPLMQEKQPHQSLAVVNVINPGTSFANLQSYLGDDKTVPFGGGAVDVARTQDGARPDEVASVFGPHSGAMTGFYVSENASGGLQVRTNETVANTGPEVLRTEGRWQTDPVGIAMQKEAQTYWAPILEKAQQPVHATLSTPLTPEDSAYVQAQVNQRLPRTERMTLPSRLVITAPRVFNPQAQRWELDRPVFDALLNQRPFDTVTALRGTLDEFAQMKSLMREALEALRPQLREAWRGMSTEAVFSEQNRPNVREAVDSLTQQDALRLQRLWSPSGRRAP
jgi:hypothetical protein